MPEKQMALKQKKWLAEWLPTTCRTGRFIAANSCSQKKSAS
jgi:hypothetical protein